MTADTFDGETEREWSCRGVEEDDKLLVDWPAPRQPARLAPGVVEPDALRLDVREVLPPPPAVEERW